VSLQTPLLYRRSSSLVSVSSSSSADEQFLGRSNAWTRVRLRRRFARAARGMGHSLTRIGKAIGRDNSTVVNLLYECLLLVTSLDARTTLEIYGHVVGDAHREAVERVAAKLDAVGRQPIAVN
jgi:hypothetical protein